MTQRMTDAELSYFIHNVDGTRYGAWYRVISSDHLEVIGAGMLETSEYAGISPESTARSILENFVRQQRSLGIHIPSLHSEEPDDPEDLHLSVNRKSAPDKKARVHSQN
jgi:hypothetical protein